MIHFSLEVVPDDANLEPDRPGRAFIMRKDYVYFERLVQKVYDWDYVEERNPVECDDCGSFLVDVFDFDAALDAVLDLINNMPESEYEEYTKLFGRLEAIKDRLYEDYGYVDDWPQELAVVFDASCSSCKELFKIVPVVGEESDEVEEFVKEPGDKVSIYIGPRKRW